MLWSRWLVLALTSFRKACLTGGGARILVYILVQMKRKHYNQEPSEIVQGHKFHSRLRGVHAAESVSLRTFQSHVRSLKEYCNFARIDLAFVKALQIAQLNPGSSIKTFETRYQASMEVHICGRWGKACSAIADLRNDRLSKPQIPCKSMQPCGLSLACTWEIYP